VGLSLPACILYVQFCKSCHEVRLGPDKAAANRAKHGISFELAKLVFDEPLVAIKEDRVEGGEYRYQPVGMIGGTTVIAVAHGYPDHDTIRIISARKATKQERKAL
jgi:uncharacterized protein